MVYILENLSGFCRRFHLWYGKSSGNIEIGYVLLAGNGLLTGQVNEGIPLGKSQSVARFGYAGDCIAGTGGCQRRIAVCYSVTGERSRLVLDFREVI